MLHKSGSNLEKGTIDFINNNETITLFSAYIKLEELKRINLANKIKQIIVRWEVEDLCKGVPDGSLPLGGEGYNEFLKKSEIKAYKVGIACREKLLKTASDGDKAAIKRAIERDKLMLKKYGG